MPELSICVLHFNRWDLTQDCVASIDDQDIPCSYEKVLMDNGSTEDQHHGIPVDWRLVRYEENRGHIVGQNRCFESAKGEWVLFVANDVRLLPNCVKALYTSALTCQTTGQFQPQLYRHAHWTNTNPVDQCGMDWRWPGYGMSRRRLQTMDVQIVPSTCYLMSRHVWKTIGGFDEKLSTSHEDVEIGLRLAKGSYRREVIPSALAIHLGNATLCHQPSHNRAAFHRDRLYVLRKHYRGFDYWSRYVAIQCIDFLAGTLRSPHP